MMRFSLLLTAVILLISACTAPPESSQAPGPIVSAPTVDSATPPGAEPSSSPTGNPLPTTPRDVPQTAETAPARVTADSPASEATYLALWEAGLAVYKAQSCGVCHTDAAAGSTGTFGPPHDGLAQSAQQRLQDPRYQGAATTAEAYVRESILQPTVYHVEGYQLTRMPMPAYTNLSDEEVNALIYFLLTDPPQAVRP